MTTIFICNSSKTFNSVEDDVNYCTQFNIAKFCICLTQWVYAYCISVRIHDDYISTFYIVTDWSF